MASTATRIIGSTITNQFGEWPLKKPIVRTTNYPPDDELVTVMAEVRSLSKLAKRCGVRRESLRDYLVRRPELKARVHALIPPKLDPDEKRRRDRLAARDYMRRKRLADPSTVRAQRRLSMAGTKPPGTKPALDPETNEYARILRADRCAYCGAEVEHLDHIEPVAEGGALGWENLTAACASCNHRKRTRSMLRFLLEGGDAHVQFARDGQVRRGSPVAA